MYFIIYLYHISQNFLHTQYVLLEYVLLSVQWPVVEQTRSLFVLINIWNNLVVF